MSMWYNKVETECNEHMNAVYVYVSVTLTGLYYTYGTNLHNTVDCEAPYVYTRDR